ncbi:phosphoribosylformylglycinamidine synthase subunit PurQ [Amorphus orientalis]|uniref:Phosphoribosylformylglycinamidine synthase subunit PurQ n=1 Tax=Amorphus orientalis TaxID=649198 RepID=A0AAE3VML7_9HYPH|nr:phosphoribosylformylglycinamidine synthase subunit PurQ [Amorphus orientalis]MDQ0314737.1 phosphoribosylformylglycinamidine synthase [Amorphus orientalis]
MKSAVIVFPGSNRDRDVATALKVATGIDPVFVWHADTDLPDVDLVVLPGGFSYGDYLRSGAIAARAAIMPAVAAHHARGGYVLGICNGFQILTESGLLPGALMRNAGLRFVCRKVKLSIERTDTAFTRTYRKGQVISCPVAHHDGNYFADPETLDRIEGNGQVVFRYAEGTNPNGSVNDIAGIADETGRILGMMPHPENLIADHQGGRDGLGLFAGLADLQPA